MIKVKFSFYSIVCCPWQYIQETDHRDIKGTVLLVHFMIKHIFLLENMLVQSIHITLATEKPSNKNTLIVLKCYFFNTKQNFCEHSFRKDFARIFLQSYEFSLVILHLLINSQSSRWHKNSRKGFGSRKEE